MGQERYRTLYRTYNNTILTRLSTARLLSIPSTPQSSHFPFRTRAEIERIIARGGLDQEQEDKLWDTLYMSIAEVHEVLRLVEVTARYPFIYPMFAFVAYSGARRSEMMRALIDDFDLAKGTVLIRERKRSRKMSTTYRRVEMPSTLVEVWRIGLPNIQGDNSRFATTLEPLRPRYAKASLAIKLGFSLRRRCAVRNGV